MIVLLNLLTLHQNGQFIIPRKSAALANSKDNKYFRKKYGNNK